jgi:DNA-binding transcriptional LysR family regulator
LQPRAEAALAAFADGERAVREVVGLQIGEVRVGAGATASTYLLPPTLRDFRERHPGVRLMLREAFTSRLLSDLRAGELDLAIVTGPGDDPWICDELVLVAAPGLDTKRAGYITFAEGSPTRAALIERFGEARIVMELGSIAAVKANVRAGVGVALLSRAAVAKDVRSRTMRIVRSADTPIRRQLSLVHRGIERMPPAAARLRRLLLGEAPRRDPKGARP